MLRNCILAASAATAASTATMIFNQSESTSIYTSVGTTVASGLPFFAVADGLNAPKFAEVYDGKGNLVWTFSNASSDADFLVDTARHADGADNGPADVFVVACDSAGCTVFGRTSATDTTQWSTALPACGTDGGGGTYTGFQAADDGSAVAFRCYYTGGATPTIRVYNLDGQTGATKWMNDLGASVKPGQGQIQISATGARVLLVNEDGIPTPNSAQAYVYDGPTGSLLATIQIPFFITAAISDSGDYVAVGDDPNVHVWKSDATGYSPAYDVAPPTAGSWIPWDMTISSGSDTTEVLVVGYISGDVRTISVGGTALATGALALNWTSLTNPTLQENPTLRADGDYVAVSAWGNDGDVPTVILLKTGSDASIFEYTTPGSMMAVDVNVVASSSGPDTIYLAAAGKHVPANRMGNGGDAFGWTITN